MREHPPLDLALSRLDGKPRSHFSSLGGPLRLNQTNPAEPAPSHIGWS